MKSWVWLTPSRAQEGWLGRSSGMFLRSQVLGWAEHLPSYTG